MTRSTPIPPRLPLGPSEEEFGPVPRYAPDPEVAPAADGSVGSGAPEPFELSWAALGAEIAAQADYARAYAGIAPRDRPYVAVPAAQLRRLETLIVELRRRIGDRREVLPGVPEDFVTPLALAQLLAPHLRTLMRSDPAMRGGRSGD